MTISALRPLTIGLVVVGLLAACGGDDEVGDDAGSSGSTAAPAATTAAPEGPLVPADPETGPVATLSPEIPGAFDGGIGPVDVIGEALPGLPEEGDDPAIGLTAPVLVGVDSLGGTVEVAPATAGDTMVVFVAHWCPHCNAEVPKLVEMGAEGRFPADLDIVAVSTAGAPERPNWPPTTWLSDTMGWEYPALFDAIDVQRGVWVAAEAYGVTAFPFVVLVDDDGTVTARWSGEREPDEILDFVGTLAD